MVARLTHRQALQHGEGHRSGRAGWLPAAVLGSDDAIASTASLMIGDGAASATKEAILYALVTIAALLVAPAMFRTPLVAAASLVSLAALGAFGGHLGGAPMLRASLRVTVGGGMAMAVTAAIGRLLGVAVG